MKIKVNGEQKEFTDVSNISSLLKANKVEQPEMVSVQLNGEFVEREDFEKTNIKENDEVDFLYFMGGGNQ
jgi:sulfur carrier protein